MMESLNDLQISCKKCNVAFKLADRVIMTKDTNFFHLLCYKSKGKIYRYFNKAATFVTWTDSKMMMAECTAVMNDLIKKNGGFENKTPTKQEQMEVFQVTNLRKTEIAAIEDDLHNKIEDIVVAERDEDTLMPSKSSATLTANLQQMMSDVEDLKIQISHFSDEKVRDENRIKSLQQQNQAFKMQICELRWQLVSKENETVV